MKYMSEMAISWFHYYERKLHPYVSEFSDWIAAVGFGDNLEIFLLAALGRMVRFLFIFIGLYFFKSLSRSFFKELFFLPVVNLDSLLAFGIGSFETLASVIEEILITKLQNQSWQEHSNRKDEICKNN